MPIVSDVLLEGTFLSACRCEEHSNQLFLMTSVDLIMDILVRLISESPPSNITGTDYSLYCVVGESEGF